MRLRAVFFACVFAALSLNCGDTPDRALTRGSTIIIAHPGFQGRGLNPSADYTRDLVFLPLMRLDSNGELEGALAESWDYAPETNTITYHLRTDARWHDGVPVTAHDLKFSMDLMTHPDVLEEDVDVFGTIEVLDDNTLRLTNSAGGLDEVFWPKHLLERLEPKDFYNWDFWQEPVGNGPYRFVNYQPHSFMELEANPDYFDGKLEVERLILKMVGQAGVRELMAGNVDAVMGVRPADALGLQDDPRFNVYYQYQSWWIQRVMYWNHRHPLFEHASVRRALTMALDRREIFQLNRIPESAPIVDAPYSLWQLAHNRIPPPIPYDPEQAKDLLKRAGWTDGDSDGVREKEGREFRFTALISEDPLTYQVDIAVYMQDQLRRVGVEMEILVTDGGVVIDRVNRGDFEAGMRPYSLGRAVSFPSSIGYENPQLTDLILRLHLKRPYQADELYKTEDPLYDSVHKIFERDAPILFLGPRIRANIVHRRIQGLSTPWRASPLWHLPYLSISEEQKP